MTTPTTPKVKEATTPTTSPTNLPPVAAAYNGADRNLFLFGWTPQAELWNGRLAMIGFAAYLFWDFKGLSVLRDLLNLLPG